MQHFALLVQQQLVKQGGWPVRDEESTVEKISFLLPANPQHCTLHTTHCTANPPQCTHSGTLSLQLTLNTVQLTLQKPTTAQTVHTKHLKLEALTGSRTLCTMQQQQRELDLIVWQQHAIVSTENICGGQEESSQVHRLT